MDVMNMMNASEACMEYVEPSLSESEITWRVIVATALTLLAGLFSGLTLGLMSLEELDLDLLITSGDEKQAKYAKRIKPVRKSGNRLLCTLVLANTAVYTLLPIVIESLADGLAAFIISTILSVLFGEIFPQAVCSRYGLVIGANAAPLVRVMMVILFPLAYPIAKLLDCLLGEEVFHAYTRHQLAQLVAYHQVGAKEGEGDLKEDETKIIHNALHFSQVKVMEVMTPLPAVYMLSIDSVLDYDTMADICHAGHSRIPVFEGKRSNIVGIILVKSLLLLSPSLKVPIREVLRVTKLKCPMVRLDLTLDEMLNEFQWGRSHMAIVRKARATLTDAEIKEAGRRVGGLSVVIDALEARKPYMKVEEADDKEESGSSSDSGDDDDDKASGDGNGTNADEVQHTKRPEMRNEENRRKWQSFLASDQFETIGVVTLEDVMEQLIGEDIVDEFDFEEQLFDGNDEYRQRLGNVIQLAVAAMRGEAARRAIYKKGGVEVDPEVAKGAAQLNISANVAQLAVERARAAQERVRQRYLEARERERLEEAAREAAEAEAAAAATAKKKKKKKKPQEMVAAAAESAIATLRGSRDAGKGAKFSLAKSNNINGAQLDTIIRESLDMPRSGASSGEEKVTGGAAADGAKEKEAKSDEAGKSVAKRAKSPKKRRKK